MAASNSNSRATRGGGPDYILPAEIPVDIAHTLDQLTNRFRAVRDGLPELIKNSKDQYSRLGVHDRSARQIVIIADTEQHRLGVLDFAGARAADFSGWTTWSSRFAGRVDLSDDIEAGHGNGGKAFMVRGATETAFLESCFEGKRTRMGFRNDRLSDRYKPGYANVNGTKLADVSDGNAKARLEEYLAEFEITSKNLPPSAMAAFEKRNAFTGVLLSGVTEWDGRQRRKVRRLAEEVIPAIIANHGQTAMTIETCEVWVIVDGKLITQHPIMPVQLDPYPGFEQPLRFEIPDILPDPETDDAVDMTQGKDGPRYLELRTSAKQLQMSDETKARNVIRIWNARNNVGNWPLHSLGVQITSVSFIYGEIRCPALVGDHLAGAERVHLNNTPLTRALEEWTRQKVKDLAEDLHRAMMGENKPRDREQARNALKNIRNLMRRYLDPDAAGEGTDDSEGDTGTGGKGKTRPRYPTVWGERLDEIVLEPGLGKLIVAAGTAVPFRSKCIERQSDGSTKPVRPPEMVLHCLPKGLVDEDEGTITGANVGAGEIWLETKDGKIASNRIPCEVLEARDVNVTPPEEPLLQGQRVKLAISFETNTGPRDDLLVEATVDEPGMGLLGRNGRFVAGAKEGEATVRIRYGTNVTEQKVFTIAIGPNRVPPPDADGSRGSDIPEILLCGEMVPGMEEYPSEQRTVAGGEELPTIIEDPLFPNVVWINPMSKESMRVRGGRGGPTGVGKISSRNFMHFVALKCFDVLKRLHVRQALKGRTITEYEFIQFAAYAEIECADFIDAAWELSDELLTRAEASSGQQIE